MEQPREDERESGIESEAEYLTIPQLAKKLHLSRRPFTIGFDSATLAKKRHLRGAWADADPLANLPQAPIQTAATAKRCPLNLPRSKADGVAGHRQQGWQAIPAGRV